jgi:hypothetical protein
MVAITRSMSTASRRAAHQSAAVQYPDHTHPHETSFDAALGRGSGPTGSRTGSVVDEVRQDANKPAEPNINLVQRKLRRIADDYLTHDDSPTEIEIALRAYLHEDVLAGLIAGRYGAGKAYITVDGAPAGFDEALAELINTLPTASGASPKNLLACSAPASTIGRSQTTSFA